MTYNDRKVKNRILTQGPLGPAGLQGLQGIQGIQGPIGPNGTMCLNNTCFYLASGPLDGTPSQMLSVMNVIPKLGRIYNSRWRGHNFF